MKKLLIISAVFLATISCTAQEKTQATHKEKSNKESILKNTKVVKDNKEINLEDDENWAFIVDGKLVTRQEFKALSSENIKQTNVYLGKIPKKYKKLLQKDYDGVVVVETK